MKVFTGKCNIENAPYGITHVLNSGLELHKFWLLRVVKLGCYTSAVGFILQSLTLSGLHHFIFVTK